MSYCLTKVGAICLWHVPWFIGLHFIWISSLEQLVCYLNFSYFKFISSWTSTSFKKVHDGLQRFNSFKGCAGVDSISLRGSIFIDNTNSTGFIFISNIFALVVWLGLASSVGLSLADLRHGLASTLVIPSLGLSYIERRRSIASKIDTPLIGLILPSLSLSIQTDHGIVAGLE